VIEWRVRPVFISSTFRDMHAERDYLHYYVFPRLDERLRERRHRLEPIDLRLGVETESAGSEEQRERLVLKVCLEEINRSRPFFLVLLGDRYGWTPPEERLKAAAREVGFETDVRGKSVTALEIEYGLLLKGTAQQRRCFIYLRNPLPYDKMPPAVAKQYSDAYSPDLEQRKNHDKLKALKSQLREDPEMGPRVFQYSAQWDGQASKVTGLEAWGEMVFQHLSSEMEQETAAFAVQAPASWNEQERFALEEFGENRSRGFVGRSQVMQQLLELATSPTDHGNRQSWGACVTGGSGSGKSALFSILMRQLSSDASILVLANAVGGTPRGSQIDAMLRRWSIELSNSLGVSYGLGEDESLDKIEAEFASLLDRASARRRVVVLLDALDQFHAIPRAEFLGWLPRTSWPENARLIATSLPSEAARALARSKGVEAVEMPGLDSEEIRIIAESIWHRYHRQPNNQVVERLLAKKRSDGQAAASSPLWLTLACEQLNLLDKDDFERAERDFGGSSEQRMRDLLLDNIERMPPDVEGLYGWLLSQNEKVFGRGTVDAFAALLALSREGWRESDLLTMMPAAIEVLTPDGPMGELDGLKLASIRRGFRAHLWRRGYAGQLDFVHRMARQAVLDYLELNELKICLLHRAIAEHIASLPVDDQVRVTQRGYHVLASGDPSYARRYYANLAGAVVPQLDFRGERVDASTLLELCARKTNRGDRDSERNKSWYHLQSLLEPIASEAMRSEFGHDLQSLVDYIIADATQSPAAGPRHLDRVLQWVESGHEPGSPLENQDIRALFSGPLIAALQKAGALPQGLRLAEALAKWASEASLDKDKSDDPSSLHNQAITLLAAGEGFLQSDNLEDAGRLFKKAADLVQQLRQLRPEVAAYRRDEGNVHDQFGTWNKLSGRQAEAERHYCKARIIFLELHREDPLNPDACLDLGDSSLKLARLHGEGNDVTRALEYYADAIDVFKPLHQAQSENNLYLDRLCESLMQAANLCLLADRMEDMELYLEQALPAMELMARREPEVAEYQHRHAFVLSKLGDLRLMGEHIEEAISLFERAAEIRERLRQLLGDESWAEGLVMLYFKLFGALAIADHIERARLVWNTCQDCVRELKSEGTEFDVETRRLVEKWSALAQTLGLDPIDVGPAKDCRPTSDGLASVPHPDAKGDDAMRTNLEYRQELAHWRALPAWKRILTKKPKRPAGIWG